MKWWETFNNHRRKSRQAATLALTLKHPVIERLQSLWANHSRKLNFALSALSFLWGLISGILLKRDYEHSRSLLSYLGLLVIISAAFRIWLEYESRLASRRHELRGLRRFLVQKPGLVAGIANFGTQYAVQYITMFCIPLLVLAGGWTTLGVTVVIAGISLVDPWWSKASSLPWFMAITRCFGAAIAISYAFPVYFPEHLDDFYLYLATVALIAALPWDLTLRWQQRRIQHFIPVLIALSITLAEIPLHSRLRLPLLSIWLKDPVIGVNIANYQLSEVWPKDEDRAKLVAALAANQAICCFTPIISPSGVSAAVTHEWVIDGKAVDRISLSAILGPKPLADGTVQTNERGFRTFSCKRNIPHADTLHELTCRVYLGNDLYLGKAAVSFH